MADQDVNTPSPNDDDGEALGLLEYGYEIAEVVDKDSCEVAEVVEAKSCCRCGQTIEPSQEVFDTDSCAHPVCAACRFREHVHCSVCSPHVHKVVNPSDSENDITPTNYLKDFAVCTKRKKITTQHIVNVELGTAEGNVGRQMCLVCERVFKSTNARYHYSCASGDKPYSCTECDKKFVKKSHMEAHLYSHLGIKPFKCSVGKCTASFTQKDKLVRHMKGHNKNEKHTCMICDKTYATQDILHFHILKVHSSAKPFHCPLCPRKYKYKKSLQIHSLKHQACRDYMCEICGKKYSLAAQLKVHKRSHIMYNRRPYKCRCGRRFVSRQNKARHLLTHNSSGDFECSLCNTTFGRKDNLERHMKNFHEDNNLKRGKVAKLTAIVPPFNKTSPVTKTKKCKQNSENTLNKSNNTTKIIKNIDKIAQQKGVKNIKTNEIISKSSNTKGCAVKMHVEALDKPSPSVIVSCKSTENQQRPSVIKSIPNLLPYRVLPPEKRFPMSTDENKCGKSPSDLMPPPFFKRNSDKLKPKNVPTRKPKVPTDDALNRCFRIIRHTSSVQQAATNCHTNEQLAHEINAVFNRQLVAIPEERSKEGSRISVPNSSLTPSNNAIDQRTCGDEVPLTSSALDNCNVSSKCVGGPTLPTSFAEVVEASDISAGGGEGLSYVPLGESSSATYTPYFDSDCFRDSDSNCYQDFDMGFQYINENYSPAEINLSAEAKSVKSVSQETVVVKKASL